MIRTKLYYKGRVSAATIMLLLAVGMAGCGKDTGAAEQPKEITTEADKAGVEEKKLPETPEKEDVGEKNSEANREEDEIEQEETPKEEDEVETIQQIEPETESQTQAGTAELTGNVHSVGADSFVISKTTTEHHEDYDLAVSVAPGAPGEELITVYVTDTAAYQYETVKNGGINPEDITSREGSYGDLQEGLEVILKGRWEKDVFYAEELVMMQFT